MIRVYFVRHAESDHAVRDDMTRPLTAKGLSDRCLATKYLLDKGVSAVYASPCKRAIDTVSDLADKLDLSVQIINDFRERSTADVWVEDFWAFAQQQWEDFDYKLPGGESLFEVQQRNIAALEALLMRHDGQAIVIGTHGMALSTIINYYDHGYGYQDFISMADVMPWLVEMTFDGGHCAAISCRDLFDPPVWQPLQRVEVIIHPLGKLQAYRFVTTFVRCRGQWLYCRARSRNCWETAGGHVEPGETPLQAAKRELYEETGLLTDELRAIADYSVKLSREYSHGQLFYVETDELPTPPQEFEMAEVTLLDGIPQEMRFPHILPVLYEQICKEIAI